MIFKNKIEFEKYLNSNNLEMINDYPGSFKEDQRNWKIAILLGEKDLPQYHLKIDNDAGYPIGVVINNNNEEVNVISLRSKQN